MNKRLDAVLLHTYTNTNTYIHTRSYIHLEHLISWKLVVESREKQKYICYFTMISIIMYVEQVNEETHPFR